MKIAEYNQMMAYLTRPEPVILPQPKPQELIDIQEQKRIEREKKTFEEASPFLMEESVDFIEREELKTGSNQYGKSLINNPETIAKVKKMFLEEKISAKEVAKRLSISEPTVGRILKDANITDFRTTRRIERFSKLKKLVEEANKGDKFILMQDLIKKAGFPGKDLFFYRGLKEEFNIPKLENQKDKIKKVFNSVVNNPDTPIKELKNFSKVIADKTGLNRVSTNVILNTLPEYSDFKPILNKITKPGFQKKAEGMTLGEVTKMTKQVKERVPAMTFTSPEKFIVQSAIRHVEKGGNKIKFVKKPGDLDAKGNRITDFDAEFIYKDKKYNFKQLLKEGKKIPAFKGVYNSFDDLNKLLSKKVIHPVTKEETTLKKVMEEAYQKGAGYGKGRSPYEIDHFKGVKKQPFSNLRVLPRRINAAEGLIREIEGQAKLGLLKTEDFTPDKVEKYIKKIGYNYTKDIDTLAKNELKLAEDILVRNRKLDTPIQIAKKAVFKKDSLSIPIQERGQKKLTSLQKIMQGGKTSGVDPVLLTKAGYEEFVKPTGKFAGQIAKGVGRSALTAADFALSAGKGATGLGLGLLLEADPIITGMSEGKTFGQTARDTFIGTAIDLIPGVNLGSLNEDLIKLANTDQEKLAVQNLIDYQRDYKRFNKELNAFKSYVQLNQIELEELGLNASDLVNMESRLAKRFKEIQTRAPIAYDSDAIELVKGLARKEAIRRKENLETGIAGKIFGDRMAKEPNFIDDKTQQILAASTGQKGATDSYTDTYRFLPQEQLSPEELEERLDMEGGIMAANGGRIGYSNGTDLAIKESLEAYQRYLKAGGELSYKDFIALGSEGVSKFFNSGGRVGFADGPMDPKRRLFLKLMGGIASLPFMSKFFGKSEVFKPVVKIAGSSTKMPDWFPDLINKVMFSGTGKRIDADLTLYEPKELPGIKIYRNDDGRVSVEGENAYGKAYKIEYEPPGYELIDETTGKAAKKQGEFIAEEEVPVNVDPDGNTDFDIEVLDDLDQILGPDTASMEKFATGKITKTVKDFTGDTGMKTGEYNVGAAEARFEQAADEAAETLAEQAEEAAAALDEID